MLRNIAAIVIAGLILYKCVPDLSAADTLGATVTTFEEHEGETYRWAWFKYRDDLRRDNTYVRVIVVSDVYMRAMYQSRIGEIPDGSKVMGLSEVHYLDEPMRVGMARFRHLCNVYLLDRDDEVTFRHEEQHCFGWNHGPSVNVTPHRKLQP